MELRLSDRIAVRSPHRDSIFAQNEKAKNHLGPSDKSSALRQKLASLARLLRKSCRLKSWS